ncbi:ArsR family transcriptional regulator [bacterium D16-51]|nr:ArsR family transcriptional regulator [bacterium D16-59]RKI59954.1 ArsR family transcriptional regulator [bacterium D16-51]
MHPEDYSVKCCEVLENEAKKRKVLKLLKRGKRTVEEIVEDTGLSVSNLFPCFLLHFQNKRGA